MTVTSDDRRLPCGRDLDGLVEQVADGTGARLDDHQRSCPHCRAALVEIDALWEPVRAVAAHRPPAPTGRLDTALDAAMRRVGAVRGGSDRDGVGVGEQFTHLDDRDGRTTVAARVVIVLARHLAAGVPGVRAALSRLVTGPGVEIVLAASYGVDLVSLGDRIRDTVARGVREQTGLELAVRVVVDDVLE